MFFSLLELTVWNFRFSSGPSCLISVLFSWIIDSCGLNAFSMLIISIWSFEVRFLGFCRGFKRFCGWPRNKTWPQDGSITHKFYWELLWQVHWGKSLPADCSETKAQGSYSEVERVREFLGEGLEGDFHMWATLGCMVGSLWVRELGSLWPGFSNC